MKNIVQLCALTAVVAATMTSCRNEPPDTIAPTVAAFTPAANAQNVYLKDEISLTFSEAVQSSSVNATTVSLAQGQTPIPSTLTLDAAGTKLVIKPTLRPIPLTGGITITADGVKDIAGNALAKTTSTFTAPEWQAPGGVAPLDLNAALTAETAPQSLAVDSSGNQVIAWSESDGTSTNIYVKRWNGVVWVQLGGLLDVNTNKDASEPAVKLDGSGNPVVAWSESSATTKRIYVKRWNGSAWIQIGASAISAPDNAETPALALDASGNPVVVWKQAVFGPNATLSSDTYIARWDGAAWVTFGSGKLGVNANNLVDDPAFNPSVALTSSGNPIVAWSESDGTSRNIYVKRWDGSSWSQVGGFLDVNTNRNAFRPSVALDASGNPVVAFNEAGTGSDASIYVKRWNGAVWSQLGSGALDVNTNATIGAGGPSLALDSSGNPTVAWNDFDGTSYNAYVKRWNAGVWEIVGTGSLDTNLARDVYGVSLAQDDSGNPSVAWNEYDGTSYNVFVKRLNRIP